ncbi:MAG: ABC transporter substrate-binding protein [Leptospirales bacterium]
MGKSKKYWKIFIWIWFIFALIVVNCKEPKAEFIKIGANSWPGYAPLYIAANKKYFDRTKVMLEEYSNTSEVMQAFRDGKINAAALTLDETLLLSQDIPNLKIVLMLDLSHGGDAIVAKSSIHTVRDLKGKQVGVENNALGSFFLTRALEIHGMRTSDIVIVNIGIDKHLKEFYSNGISAVVTFEPVLTQLASQHTNIIFDSSGIPGEIVDVLAIKVDPGTNFDGLIHHLLVGWFKAVDYLKSSPKKSANIMATRQKITPDQFTKSLSGLRIPDYEENCRFILGDSPILFLTGRKLSRIMIENGLLKQPVNLRNLIYDKPLRHFEK